MASICTLVLGPINVKDGLLFRTPYDPSGVLEEMKRLRYGLPNLIFNQSSVFICFLFQIFLEK